MADLQLDKIAEQLGPDWVNLGLLLAGGLVLAFIATVVVPSLPRRRVRKAAEAPRAAIVEVVPHPPARQQAQPMAAYQHFGHVSHVLEAEIERSEAIAGYQAAAMRQIDAVEFALAGLYADIASVSSHARRRHESAARSSSPRILDLAA
jgi:hypothetical protein